MTIDKLTSWQMAQLRAGDAYQALQECAAEVIDALTARVAELERAVDAYESSQPFLREQLNAAAARAEAADRRAQSWERGHDYAWAEKQRAEQRLAAAETEMRRIGYGEEVIYCFDANGKPTHTSRVGDLSWDTRENRARTFQFISDTLERDRGTDGSSARAEHLKVHGLDPAEIEVDEVFRVEMVCSWQG